MGNLNSRMTFAPEIIKKELNRITYYDVQKRILGFRIDKEYYISKKVSKLSFVQYLLNSKPYVNNQYKLGQKGNHGIVYGNSELEIVPVRLENIKGFSKIGFKIYNSFQCKNICTSTTNFKIIIVCANYLV